MIGLILCGGKSSRMGTDKGLLLKENIPWARLAFNKLAELGLHVLLSVNKMQTEFYQSYFSIDHLVEDNEQLIIGGPLKGLLSVHQFYPNEDIFLLACDMPLIEKKVFDHLIENYNSNPEKEVFVFENEGNIEPLCAIYTSKALKNILSLYICSQLKKHSMKYIIEQFDLLKINLPPEWKTCFNNYNHPDDLSNLIN